MKIMAVDFGDARTGLAICDRGELLASPAGVIQEKHFPTTVQKVAQQAQELDAQLIVVGHPLNMDGSCGDRAKLCEEFADKLRELVTVPVELWDERQTTVSAIGYLNETNTRGKKRKQVIDAVASGSCDAGVLRCRADEEMMLASILSRKRLDSTPLGTYHLRLALDPHHPLAAAESITQEMLSPYPRVTLDAGAVENLVLFESELQEPVQDICRISVFSRDSAVAILHAVPGACMPCSPVPQAVADLYHLILRPVQGVPCRYRDLYITRSGTLQHQAEQMLLSELYALQGDQAPAAV